MTATTAHGRCGSCGTAAPLGASFCPSCGAPLGDVSVIRLEPIGSEPGGRQPLTPDVETYGRQLSRRTKALAVVGIAALLGVLVATRSPAERVDHATSTTVPASTTTSTAAPDSTTTSADPGEPAPTTTTLSAISGLPATNGYLVALSAEGELLQIDLAGGKVAKRPVEGGGANQFIELRPLGSGLVIHREDRIELLTRTGEQRSLGSGWIAAASSRHLLIARYSGTFASFELVDEEGETVSTVNATQFSWTGLTPDGRVVVSRGQRIGTIDAETGAFTHIADGIPLYTASGPLVRITCATITDCELRSGPHDDPDRWRAPTTVLPQQADVSASPDGRLLVAMSWETGERTLIDLSDGSALQLGTTGPTGSTSFSADGRWLAFIASPGSEIELVSTDTGQSHTVPLPGSELVAVTFTSEPVIANG